MRKALLVIFLNTLVPGPEDTAACQARDGRLTSRNMRTTNSTLPRLFALVGLAAFVALASSPKAGAGIRFQPVSAPAGADTLALAPDGATLWAGTIRGVWRLSAGAWSFDGLSDKAVSSLAIADGSVWAATGAGLWRRGADGTWSREALPGPPAVVNAVFFDGTSLHAGGDAVLRRSGGAWTALASPGGIVVSFASLAGDLVAGRATNGAVRYTGSVASPLVAGMGPGEGAQALAVFGGALVAGTSLGVYTWTGAAWALDTAFGVHDVRALAVAGGSLHAATLDAGVVRRSGSSWSALNGGLSVASAKSLALLGGDLFAGTSGGPVYRLLGSSWSEAGAGLTAAVVADVAGPSGAAPSFVAARGAGVVNLTASAPENLVAPGCGSVVAAAAASPSHLLVASNCGPLLGNDSGFLPAASGLPAGVILSSLTPSAGEVLGGTTNAGIWRFAAGGWSADNAGLSPSVSIPAIRQVGSELFAATDSITSPVVRRGSTGTWTGASSGLDFGANVFAFAGSGDPSAPVFAGLSGSGVWRRDASVWRKDAVGLTSSTVFSLDHVGRLWAASGTAGLFRKQAGAWLPEGSSLPKGADVRVVRAGSGSTLLVGTAGHGLFRAPALAGTRTLPVVLDVTSGAGVRFRTELGLGNRSAGPVTALLSFQPAPGFPASGPGGTAPITLAPGTEIHAADALDYLRSLGLPIPVPAPQAPVAGSLTLTPVSAPSGALNADDLYANVRSYARNAAGGTYGVFLDATSDLDAGEDEAWVYGLRSIAGVSRSNLAVTHVSGRGSDPATFEVQAYDASGAAAPVALVRTLAPGEWFQWNGVLAQAGLPDGSFGYARVRRTAGSGAFIAYGVVNDAATSDGSVLPMFRPGGRAAARKLIVPVVVDTFGEAGSHFTTELTLANDGILATPVDLVYRPAPGFGSATGAPVVTLSLAARQQTTIPDAIQYLRDHGVSIPDPATGGPQAGTLAITFRSLQSLDSPRTVALARTSTPNPDAAIGGTFGVFYPALPSGGGARTSAVVPGLTQDGTVRSNLAVVHAAGGSGGPIGLEVRLYDAGTGAQAGSPLAVTLNPGDWFQWTRILEKAGAAPGTTRAWARVTRTSGDDTFLAYGVLNDAATSDGSVLAMIPAEEE